MNRRKRDTGIVIDIALLLLCFAVFSSCIATGLFAKYVNNGNETGIARTAKWSVDVSAGSIVRVNPDGDGTVSYPMTITSQSETAAYYDVLIRFSEDMSDKIEDPRLNGVAPEESSFTDRMTFRKVGSIAAASSGEIQESAVLTFTVKSAYLNTFTGSILDYDNNVINGGSMEIPFAVTVRVVQVD